MEENTHFPTFYTKSERDEDVQKVKDAVTATKKEQIMMLQISGSLEGIEWDYLDEKKTFKTSFKNVGGVKVKVMFMTDIVSFLRIKKGTNCTVVFVEDGVDDRLEKPKVPLIKTIHDLVKTAGITPKLHDFGAVGFVYRQKDADSDSKTFIDEYGSHFSLSSHFSYEGTHKTGELFEICFQPLIHVKDNSVTVSLMSAKAVIFPKKRIVGKFKVDRLRGIITRWKKYASIRKSVRRAEIKKMAAHFYNCPDFEYKGETYKGKGYLKGMQRFENEQIKKACDH